MSVPVYSQESIKSDFLALSRHLEEILKNPANRTLVTTIAKNILDVSPDIRTKRILAKLKKGDALDTADFSMLRIFFAASSSVFCVDQSKASSEKEQELNKDVFNLAKTIVEKEDTENNSYTILKQTILEHHLDPHRIRGTFHSRTGQHYHATLLDLLCWHGRIEMIRWLLDQLICSPDPDTERGNLLCSAAGFIIFSPETTSAEKIAIIRLFPPFNPFQSVSGLFILLLWGKLYEVDPEVLQCVFEGGMYHLGESPIVEGVLTRQATFGVQSYLCLHSLLDAFINMCSKVDPSLQSKVDATIRIMLSNGIFPETDEGMKSLQSHEKLAGFFAECKEVREAEEKTTVDRNDLLTNLSSNTPLLGSLKDMVCDFYGNPKSIHLLNSRLCHDRVTYLAQGVSKQQANEKLTWWREELWDDASPARPVNPQRRQNLTDLLFRLALCSSHALLDYTTRFKKSDEALIRKVNAKILLLNAINTARFPREETSTAATAAAAASVALPLDVSRFSAQTREALFERYATFMTKLDELDNDPETSQTSMTDAATSSQDDAEMDSDVEEEDGSESD